MKALFISLTILVFIIPAHAQYGGGTGEPNDPYLIYTAEQLNAIGAYRSNWDKHFRLMADIDMKIYTGIEFNIIGDLDIPFTGEFDGNSHTISNFNYTSTQTGRIGLFKFIDDPNAQIINLGLINPNIDAGTGDSVGSLIGYLKAGRIVGCYVEDGSVSGEFTVGGLVGHNSGTIDCCYSTGNVSGKGKVGGLVANSSGTIINCYSTGDISGEDQVGGLVGINWGTITNCSSIGSITGNNYVGGLVGQNSNFYSSGEGRITDCYATGTVTGTTNVGGLVGRNGLSFEDGFGWTLISGTISNSYSTSSISGNEDVGGLVGFNDVGIITNCYATSSASADNSVGGLVGYNWDRISNCYSLGSVLGTSDVGGLVGFNQVGGSVTSSFWDIETSRQTTSAGVIGLCTAEMQSVGTFLEAGWDFVGEMANGTENIWWILEGQDYPRLWWQYGRAFSPHPQDGAIDVIQPLFLSWAPGGFALSHDVYFGKDEEAVADATTESPGIYRRRQPAEMTTYDTGTLDLDKTYYWRIDEVDEVDPNSPWKGDVWCFTTANFIVVDDFENYDAYNQIWWTWRDGLGYATESWPEYGTGSVVGDERTPSYTEETIVHGGKQSMPYRYDNDKLGFAKYSEAEKTLSYPRDWTEEGVEALSLWFYGESANDSEPMYVAISNRFGAPVAVYHNDPNAVGIDAWTEWVIQLQKFADEGIDLTNVDRIAIGFGTRGNMMVPGGSGKTYFDDIRLYRPRPAASFNEEVNVP